MNKQKAIIQIMEIKAMLPKELQAKLIEAVRTLARFKMIDVNSDLPYKNKNLFVTKGLIKETQTIDCLVRTPYDYYYIDNMKKVYGQWTWEWNSLDGDGPITNWLPLKPLLEDKLMDELGNELIIE